MENSKTHKSKAASVCLIKRSAAVCAAGCALYKYAQDTPPPRTHTHTHKHTHTHLIKQLSCSIWSRFLACKGVTIIFNSSCETLRFLFLFAARTVSSILQKSMAMSQCVYLSLSATLFLSGSATVAPGEQLAWAADAARTQ